MTKPVEDSAPRMKRGGLLSGWIAAGLAALVSLVGLAMALAGFYLIWLGGSWYYAVVGAAFAVGGALVATGSPFGGRILAAALIATLGWSAWEAGLDGWRLMPRIAGPLILVLPLLVLINASRGCSKRLGRTSLLFLVVAVAGFVGGLTIRQIAPPDYFPDPVYRTGVGGQLSTSRARAVETDRNWGAYGKDSGAKRFSHLSQITPANVGKLREVWRTSVAPTPNGLETTPLAIDGVLYLCTNANDVVALDAETGRKLWRHDARTDLSNIHHPVCRGVTYFRDDSAPETPCSARILLGTLDGRLLAMDALTGASCPDFGVDGTVSLLEGLGDVPKGYYGVTSPPALIGGNVVVGAWIPDDQYWGQPSGVVRAYDVATGALAWAWDSGRPERTGAPPPGETYTPSTPNVWAPITADPDLNLVYVATGAPTPDWYGAQRRPFDDKYSTSVVALDGTSGRVRWSFQTTHHDLWDYDLPSGATLVDIPRGKTTVKALIQPTKTGELFILDRASGHPLFPVVERPVPQDGALPSERLSPTQPFSYQLPGFGGPRLTESAMWGITPLDQLYCRIRYREARNEGIYTPPGATPVIAAPGYVGGMEWGGIAVDPARSVAIINSNTLPNYVTLISRAQADKEGLRPATARDMQWKSFGVAGPMKGTPYAVRKGGFFSPLQIPCSQPPFGRITALDLRSGKPVWTRPFGTASGTGPFGIRSGLPFRIGTPNIGGAAVTASGLIFIGAAPDRKIRAISTATGEELWQARLPASGNATPITFWSERSRRQFIVIAAGSAMGFDAEPGDSIVAFALPRSELLGQDNAIRD